MFQRVRALCVVGALLTVASLYVASCSTTAFDVTEEGIAGDRTAGGSVPDGARILGRVAVPYVGVRAAAAEASGPVVQVRLVYGDGRALTTRAAQDGTFRFLSPPSGIATLECARDQSLGSVELTIPPRGGPTTTVLMTLPPPCTDPALDVRGLTIGSDLSSLAVGTSAVVSASLDAGAGEAGQVAWVMRSVTDAELLPTEAAGTVEVRAGTEPGEVLLQAQVERTRSNVLALSVVE